MRTHPAITALALILFLPAASRAEEAETRPSEDDPLAPFEQLVGGQWHLGDSYQEFEWGVGRRSVRARGYFLVEGAAELVSEGAWFWHPGEGQVRGYFTASGMPAALFDYRTRFEGNTMVHDLRSYGANGEEAAYIETWEFLDDARYVWRLLRQTPDGPKEEMSGTYTRRRE